MDDNTTPEGDVQQDELQQVKRFIEEHGKTLAIAVCVALAVAVIPAVYRGYRKAKNEKASLMLSSRSEIRDLEAMVEKYSAVPAAALAVLKLAKAYYDTGDYDAALSRYEEFEKRYPEHPMRPAAGLGRVHCLEAKRWLDKALLGFIAFAEKYPDHFLTPQAIFGKGRCLVQRGRLAEAKAVYEDFIAANEDSVWLPRAEDLLESVNQKLESPAGDTAGGVSGEGWPQPEATMVLPTALVPVDAGTVPPGAGEKAPVGNETQPAGEPVDPGAAQSTD